MATAVLLCATIITIVVLAGIGWLIVTMHPDQLRLELSVARLLRVKVDLQSLDQDSFGDGLARLRRDAAD